ncbi:MAG: hypothetical protein AB8B50_21620 [Pirellulaceae bacterium]
MKGVVPKAAQKKLNERVKKKEEKKRGDHWIDGVSVRTRQRYLTFDANYYKTRLHKGLKAPIGTSESVSIHEGIKDEEARMIADHCNSEVPTWVVARTANSETSSQFEWQAIPGRDNHCFDNLVGCLLLLSYEGGTFSDAAKPKQRRRYTPAEMNGNRKVIRAR